MKKWAQNRKLKSTYESKVEKFLESAGVHFEHEPFSIKYTIPSKQHGYTPDFVLANGVIIEAKGYFDIADRAKHLLIKEQHPKLDIRFLFYRNNKLSKRSKTRYTDWCEKHGFKYAVGIEPPEDWYTS